MVSEWDSLKILVDGDSISVKDDSDNDWEERDVSVKDEDLEDDLEEDEKDEGIEDLLLSEEGLGEVLEDMVGEASEDSGRREDERYSDEKYDNRLYEEVGIAKYEGIEIEMVEEVRPEERSVLEMAGFRDEEAERRRKERREGNFI